MGTLKKKTSDSTEKVQQEDSTKVEKKPPVKAQPRNNGIGGIFTSKVAAIMSKILGKE